MNENMEKELNLMASYMGFQNWSKVPFSERGAIMQLTLLGVIAHQLEEIDRTLQSSQG